MTDIPHIWEAAIPLAVAKTTTRRGWTTSPPTMSPGKARRGTAPYRARRAPRRCRPGYAQRRRRGSKPDVALSVNIRYASPRAAGVVACPGSVGVARRSVGALHRVRDAGWLPGAGQPRQRDPAHAACGFRRIPPSWRFRRRGRAAIATAPLPERCRRHRSRRHHRINRDEARAVAGLKRPLSYLGPPKALPPMTSPRLAVLAGRQMPLSPSP